MTIDEAIPILHDMYNYYNDTNLDAYMGFVKEDNNAIETALDTMHKYQKIEQILDDWENSGEEDDPINIIDNIEEVIEDGNDNRKDNRNL